MKRTEMDALAQMQAQNECRDVILAAAVAVDAQDYAALVALFCEDATVVRPGGAALYGRAEILASYLLKDANRMTHHLVCNHQVQVLPSGESAHSRCKVLLYVSDKNHTLTAQGRKANAKHQVGTIEDLLVLTAEGWKIQKRHAWFDVWAEA
jgi:ketosteroid isomerase-like protein